MHKQFLFIVNFLFFFNFPVESQNLDFKVIPTVRHGLDHALEYIEKNLYRSNVDCILGVAFVRAFMNDAYQKGAHIMDNTSLRLLSKATEIIEASRYFLENDTVNGNNWKFKYLVDEDIWSKNIKYKDSKLLPSWKTENPYFLRDIMASEILETKSSDFCLREIINSTKMVQDYMTPCIVSADCWNGYFRNKMGHGYLLTHKLLLLQIAKARKCLIDRKFYDIQVRDICSTAMSDAFSANVYGNIDDIFDLFLEQVLLCGYEGFTEFIQNNWLYFLLKSQRSTGCFTYALHDNLKSRIKKDMTIFGDGCTDHTTGLGAAVLALYYNYIVKEVSM